MRMAIPHRRTSSRAKCRRGAAATELAMMLPILITLALGASDFARAIHDYIAVANASRAGAEYGATHRFTSYTRVAWESQVRAAILAEMDVTRPLDPDKLQISINAAPEKYDLVCVTVDVEYSFEPVVHWPGLPYSIQLWRRTSMREIQ